MKKIEDTLNFGPVSTKALNDIGITTLEELKRKGWEETFLELVTVHPRFINLNMLKAIIGATQGKHWNNISSKDLKKAKELISYLKQK